MCDCYNVFSPHCSMSSIRDDYCHEHLPIFDESELSKRDDEIQLPIFGAEHG